MNEIWSLQKRIRNKNNNNKIIQHFSFNQKKTGFNFKVRLQSLWATVFHIPFIVFLFCFILYSFNAKIICIRKSRFLSLVVYIFVRSWSVSCCCCCCSPILWHINNIWLLRGWDEWYSCALSRMLELIIHLFFLFYFLFANQYHTNKLQILLICPITHTVHKL